MLFLYGKNLNINQQMGVGHQKTQSFQKKSRWFFKNNPFFTDFLFGGLGGLISGKIVAPIEYIKVVCQSTPRDILLPTLKSQATRTNMRKLIIPFATTFSGVCSLQFSVNHRIGQMYGKVSGLIASAITGTFFLTAIDHVMFRRHMKKVNTLQTLRELYNIRKLALWTGFTPMLGRQSIFVLSVLHLGPLVGKLLSGNSQQDVAWSSLGRVITGLLTTLISQPFDTLARAMQKSLLLDPSTKPSLYKSYIYLDSQFKKNRAQNKKYIHPLFYGSLPRIALATFGGVIAGGIYDWLKKQFVEKQGEKQVL